MTHPNGHSDNGDAAVIQEPVGDEALNNVPLPPDCNRATAGGCDKSKTASQAADPTEPLCNHWGRCARHCAADLCCYVDAPPRRATESARVVVPLLLKTWLGERHREQRQEPISDHRFWSARHKRNSRRLSERTRSTTNCNETSSGNTGGWWSGDFGIDTAFRGTAAMAGAALSAGLGDWRC